jgi:hypothetical protein
MYMFRSGASSSTSGGVYLLLVILLLLGVTRVGTHFWPSHTHTHTHTPSLLAESPRSLTELKTKIMWRPTVSLYWCKTPFGTQDQILVNVRELRSFFMWGALSDERTGLSFTTAAVLISRDHILLYQIRDSPTLRARSPYLYPPGTRWPSYTPRHWVPFSSPPTTRKATVEVFESVSTRSSRTEFLLNNI